MATSSQLRAWASTLRGWAPAVDNTKVRQRIIQPELGHLLVVVLGFALIVGLGLKVIGRL